MLLPFLLSSCFTMGLWGFNPSSDVNRVTGEEEFVYEYDDSTSWTWARFGLRLLGTPITLALDCLTAPIQVFFLGSDDDC